MAKKSSWVDDIYGESLFRQVASGQKDHGAFEVSGTMVVTFANLALLHNMTAGHDPCDEWPVVIVDGVALVFSMKESGVSPFTGWNMAGTRFIASWRYEVVETGFLPYGVFRYMEGVPL